MGFALLSSFPHLGTGFLVGSFAYEIPRFNTHTLVCIRESPGKGVWLGGLVGGWVEKLALSLHCNFFVC